MDLQGSLAQAQAYIQTQLQTIPPIQKILLLVVLVGFIGAAYWFIMFQPLQAEITAMNDQLEQLNQEISTNEAKVKRLDALKAEYAVVEDELTVLKDQLPPEEEAALLLKQISEMSRPKGLELLSWKPLDRVQHPEGLYVSLPVTVEMMGGYHAVATFFDQIRNLQRVISISNVKIGNPQVMREGEEGVNIRSSFLITAYALPRVSGKGLGDEKKTEKKKKEGG